MLLVAMPGCTLVGYVGGSAVLDRPCHVQLPAHVAKCMYTPGNQQHRLLGTFFSLLRAEGPAMVVLYFRHAKAREHTFDPSAGFPGDGFALVQLVSTTAGRIALFAALQ